MLYIPARGGANKANRALMEGLAARGHRCHVVAPATGRQGPATAAGLLDELAGRQVAFVDSPAAIVFRYNKVTIHAVKDPSVLHRRAIREIDNFEPTVTLVSSCLQLEPILQHRGTRTIYIAHSPWELPFGPGHALENPSGAAWIRRTDGIIAVSNDLQRRIREGCGRDAAVLAIPAYGTGPFRRMGRFGSGFVTIINPCAYKGISIFKEVVARMPHIQFAAVPSWGTTAAGTRLLQQFSNVTIIPPSDDIAPVLERTGILLAPSLWPEGFPLITLETMIHGIPVIASDSGGLPEAKLGIDYVLPVRPIEHYSPLHDERGLPIPIIPAQDVGPWVQALEKLTSDKDHYEKLADASRQAALRFVSSLTLDPFEEYLETIARTPRVAATPTDRGDSPHCAKDALRTRIDRLSPDRRALLAVRLSKRHAAALGRPPIPGLPRSPGFNSFPLSFAQQRLWFVEQLDPTRPRYSAPQAIRMQGRLDIRALERSIREVISRHEILRTSFPITSEGPVQRIAPAATFSLAVVDLRCHLASQREAELMRMVDDEAQEPFDLAHGPLTRAKLVHMTEDEYVLLLSIHHLVSDGWSLGILFREVEGSYNATVRGAPTRLPDLPIQYADFAVWQRQYLTGDTLDRALAYWKERLGPEVPVLELPTDRPRPPVQTYRGASCRIELSSALTRSLHTLSEREGATLFMTLLAAFKILLHRHSGQDHVTVGSPIAGRNYKEIEGLIGLFVNALVLRTELSGNPTFRELLRRVRATALGAYAHQDLPFEKLVEELRPERDLSRAPLFQVFFNMLSYDHERLELDGLTTQIVEFPKREGRFDLTLYAREHHDSIGLNLVFNLDLFDEERAADMLAQLESLLDQIVHNPDERILDFSLVTARSRSIVPDPTCVLRPQTAGTVPGEFDKNAWRFSSDVAIIDPRQTVSYGTLNACANRIADYLRASGIRPRDVVAVCAHRGAALAAAVLGVLKSGATFTILDPAFPAPWLAAQLRSAKPRGLIAGTELSQPANCLSETAATIPCRLEIPPRVCELAELLQHCCAEDREMSIDPNDPAYIMFTSGSTGTGPKGILGTHKPLVHFLNWHCRTFGLNASDRFSMLSGLSHDPVLRDIFTPLWLGATLCIPKHEHTTDPDHLAAWMHEMKVTVAHITPAMAEVLTSRAGDGRTRCIPSLRHIFFAGDVLTQHTVGEVRDLAPHAVCVNSYGTTETPQAMGYHIVSGGDDRRQPHSRRSTRVLPVGRGIDGAQLLVLNQTGRQGGIGELGEICVRTPYLSEGYIDDRELTARRFVPNPFTADPRDRVYRTGDLGRYNPTGDVDFCGRIDRQAKIRGCRVEPAEIEAALTGHEAVTDAAVTVATDDRFGEKLVAYVACADNTTTLSLRGYLRRLLPDYMVPTQFVLLDTIPLTPNGKIDYGRLAPASSHASDGRDSVPPSTATEREIAEIWKQVLGTDTVGLCDNFFDLGGHSLMVIKAASQIEKRMGIHVPLREFFGQTLGQFAASCEQAVRSKAGVYVA